METKLKPKYKFFVQIVNVIFPYDFMCVNAFFDGKATVCHFCVLYSECGNFLRILMMLNGLNAFHAKHSLWH